MRLILAFLLFAIFFSCSNSSFEVQKEFFVDGSLKREIKVFSDGIFEVKEYYQSGEQKSYQQIIEPMNLKVFKSFFPNGSIKQEGRLENGVPEGWLKNYYKNGNLEWESFMKNGKPYGCCGHIYRPDGSKKRSRLFSYGGELKFIAHYNQSNQLIKTEGKNITLLVDKTILTKGDTITIEIGQIRFDGIDTENFIVINRAGKPYLEGKIKDNIHQTVFDQAGDYSVVVKSVFSNNNNGTRETTSSYNIDSLNCLTEPIQVKVQ
jgi:hypothetical protein